LQNEVAQRQQARKVVANKARGNGNDAQSSKTTVNSGVKNGGGGKQQQQQQQQKQKARPQPPQQRQQQRQMNLSGNSNSNSNGDAQNGNKTQRVVLLKKK
jgi:hypothetical protein